MPRYPQLLVVLSLVAAACGAGEPASTVSVPTTVTPQVFAAAPTTDAAGAPESDPVVEPSAVEANPAPSGVEGPVAPDFSLVLGDGTTFTLSEEAKPVYMVFWAEW